MPPMRVAFTKMHSLGNDFVVLDARAQDIDGRYAWWRLAVSVLVATIGGVGLWSTVVVLPAIEAVRRRPL